MPSNPYALGERRQAIAIGAGASRGLVAELESLGIRSLGGDRANSLTRSHGTDY